MPNNSNVELIIGGYVCSDWDAVVIDSDLEVPADGWSLSVQHPDQGDVPVGVRAGELIELRYQGQTVLRGVVDQCNESCTRQGRQLKLSGRDMAALLLDNSVKLQVQQQLSVFNASGLYFLEDPVAEYFLQGIKLPTRLDFGLLDRQMAVEPSESLWSVLSKAAEVMGQYIWVDAEGDIYIGNPFYDEKRQQPPVPRLTLNRNGRSNNVLSAEYTEDATALYSEVIVLGQDGDTKASSTFSATETAQLLANPEQVIPLYTGPMARPPDQREPTAAPTAPSGNQRDVNPPEYVGRTQRIRRYPRRRIVADSLADTPEQAMYRAEKIMQDGNLSAYMLTLSVAGWTCQTGQVWATGWTVQFDSDVMSPHCSGDWVVMGRTLELSRGNGKITQLRLKRQQFWMQPVAPSPLPTNDDAVADPFEETE